MMFLNNDVLLLISLGAPIATTDVDLRAQSHFRRSKRDIGIVLSQLESTIYTLYFGVNGHPNDVPRAQATSSCLA